MFNVVLDDGQRRELLESDGFDRLLHLHVELTRNLGARIAYDADIEDLFEARQAALERLGVALLRRVQLHQQARDGGRLEARVRVLPQRRDVLLAHVVLAHEVLALGGFKVELVGQLKVRGPAIGRQHLDSFDEVLERQVVRGRFFGLPAGDEIELRQQLGGGEISNL